MSMARSKLQGRLFPTITCPFQSRGVSTRTTKQRVLAQPDRFRPPSHGRRRARPAMPNVPLSEEAEALQEKKQYPHMMPPEGTFMHWFLTNRSIHLWITMGTLTSLATFVAWENYKHSTVFRPSLPDRDFVMRHPIQSWRMLIDAIKHDIRTTSDKVHDERARGVEDMQKRASYRKIHGGSEDDGVEFWPAFEKRANPLERPLGFIPGGDTQERRPRRFLGLF